MDGNIISVLIPLASVILGSSISWFASIYTTNKNIKAQNDAILRNKAEVDRLQKINIYESKKRIYADIINALFEAIRVRKKIPMAGIGITPVGLAFNNNYSELIENIGDDIGYMGIVTVNRFYGILEKIRHDIIHFNNVTDNITNIDYSYLILLSDFFSDNYIKILETKEEDLDINKMKNEMVPVYKNLVEKLQNDINAGQLVQN